MSDSSTDNGAVNLPDGAPDPEVKPGERSQPLGAAAAADAQKPVRSKRRKRTIRGLIALAVLIVVVVGGSAIYVEVEIGHIKTVKVKVTPQTGPADDILLVGSTSRCAVTSSAQVKLFHLECLDGVNGVNSDVIMILRLQPGRTPTLLSIPRDTFVPDARAGGLYNKVDAALADGPNQLVDAIQQDFGIPINHYVVLNFGTFEGIVNALGGISMYFPTTLRDYDSFLSIDRTGCVHINGVEVACARAVAPPLLPLRQEDQDVARLRRLRRHRSHRARPPLLEGARSPDRGTRLRQPDHRRAAACGDRSRSDRRLDTSRRTAC